MNTLYSPYWKSKSSSLYKIKYLPSDNLSEPLHMCTHFLNSWGCNKHFLCEPPTHLMFFPQGLSLFFFFSFFWLTSLSHLKRKEETQGSSACLHTTCSTFLKAAISSENTKCTLLERGWHSSVTLDLFDDQVSFMPRQEKVYSSIWISLNTVTALHKLVTHSATLQAGKEN